MIAPKAKKYSEEIKKKLFRRDINPVAIIFALFWSLRIVKNRPLKRSSDKWKNPKLNDESSSILSP